MAAAAPAAGPLARAAAAGGAPGLAGPTAASHDSSSNSSGRGGGSGPPVPVVQHGTVSSNLHSSSPVLAGTVSSNFGSSSGGSGSSGRRRAGGLGAPSVRVQQLLRLLNQFMEQHVYPNEHVLEEHAGGPNRCVWGFVVYGGDDRVSCYLHLSGNCSAAVCQCAKDCRECAT